MSALLPHGAERADPTPFRMLVTGMGGAAGVAFLKALRETDALIFAADMDPYAVGLYLVPPERRLLVPGGAADAFVPRLLDLCRQHRIGLLVPTVDSELLPIARARAAFQRAGTRVLLASEATLAVCLDKLQLLEACRGVVPLPRFTIFDADFAGDGWAFPLIVKPRTASGGRGVQLVRARAELDALPRDERLLVQEYLPGEEYSVDVLAGAGGGILAAVPRVRLKVDSGVAVAGRTLRDPHLEELAGRVARRIGLTGIANIQFRRDVSGQPALLEVNPRFPGTMPLTVASGVNMPHLAVREAMGWPVPQASVPPHRELAMVRFWEERFVAPDEFAALEARRDAVATAPLGAVA